MWSLLLKQHFTNHLLHVSFQKHDPSHIIFDLFRDSSIALDNNLVQILGCLDRVRLLVHPLQLFQSTALRFDTERD